MAQLQGFCPKCDGSMELGFVPELGYNSIARNVWLEGEPVPSFWTGIKISGKVLYAVQTYRCVSCGYLESYARTPKKGINADR